MPSPMLTARTRSTAKLLALIGFLVANYGVELFVSPIGRGDASRRNSPRVLMYDGMQDEALTSLGFGQFKEKTYQEVLASDPDFCAWVLTEAAWPGASENLQNFAAYIKQARPDLEARTAKRERVNNIVQFGKYKGHAFEAVLKRDPEYCTWLMSQENQKPQVDQFVKWLRQRDVSALTATSDQSENIVKFGRHIGITFEMVLKIDPEYCGWLLSLDDTDTNPDRKPFSDWLKTQTIPSVDERPKDVITFGQHKGKSFQEVLEEDGEYGQWAVDQVATGEVYPQSDLARFVAYAQQAQPDLKPTAKRERVNNIVQFGQYKGYAFEAVLRRDPEYCTWLMSQEDQRPQVFQFVKWLRQRDVSALTATSDQSENIVKFGRHIGITFEMVLKIDPQYCEWLLSLDDTDTNPDQKPFIDWLKTQTIPSENERPKDVITFGQHKGKSFQEVLEEDGEYCLWAVDQVAKGEAYPESNLSRFVAWMKEHVGTSE